MQTTITHFRNIAVPVLLMVRAIAFHDFVILKICLTLSGILGSCSSLLKSPSSSADTVLVLALGSPLAQLLSLDFFDEL